MGSEKPTRQFLDALREAIDTADVNDRRISLSVDEARSLLTAYEPPPPAPSGSLRAVAEEVLSIDSWDGRKGSVHTRLRALSAQLAAEVIRLEAEVERARAFRVTIETLVETDGCSCQCDCGSDLIARAFEHYDECEAASSGSLCLAHMIEPLLHIKQEDSPDGR